jgi:putative membrane protein
MIPDLLVGTISLRPYVFGFLAAFLLAGAADLGWRRTLRFWACVSPVAWVAEVTSTRTGFPFGLYHYTGLTRGQEIFVADVPLMDPLSFAFLTYAAFCLARGVLRGRRVPPAGLALTTGVLMVILDLVIDPVAVLGERWFLGSVFAWAEPGIFFGVPLTNFAGWLIVGTVGTRLFLGRGVGPTDRCDAGGGVALAADPQGRRRWPGIALYYAVLAFNLLVAAWINEWLLLLVGVILHAVTAAGLWIFLQRPAVRLGLENQRA